MKRFTLTIILLSFLIIPCDAQKKSLQLGIKLLNELTFYNGFVPGVGGQLIYEIGRHSGIESGIYFDNQITTFYFYSPSVSIFSNVSERHISIPLWYHFHSKAINFSAGPAMSYFVGWKYKKSNPLSITVTDNTTNLLQIISSAGISKSINLSKSIILEPEMRFNYIIGRNDGNLSLNISVRKKIF